MTLFDCLDAKTMDAAAVLCGMENATAAFRNALRDIAYNDDKPLTVGSIAAAYLVHRLSSIAAPVAWCQLTPSGKIAYFDGKPMVMPGSAKNEQHPTRMFAIG